MECVSPKKLLQSRHWILATTLGLMLAACGGSSDDDDDSQGTADTTISISETFNLDAGSSVLMQQQYASYTNGSGIGMIFTEDAAGAQPANGYSASTIDIINPVASSVVETLDFTDAGLGNNATAAQLADFFELQNNNIDATATTLARLTLSTNSVTFGDQLTVNGAIVIGNSISEVMADINRLPEISASIDGSGVISVTATDGNDLRINLGNAAVGQTIGIESVQNNDDIDIVIDSATIGDGQTATKATIGGTVTLTLTYPLQLDNAGSGNIFGTTLINAYSGQNSFDATDADTYNHAGSLSLRDSFGNTHEMTQYFVRSDDLGGLYPNRWTMHVLIDGEHVGAADTNGNPMPASFELVFDSNGQLDGTQTDPIAISHWIPRNDSGNPNGAATARITIDIAGSSQFGGAFTLTNVSVE